MLQELVEKKGNVEIYVKSSGENEQMNAVNYIFEESGEKIVMTSVSES